MKRCYTCNTEKPLSEFYAHRTSRDGVFGKCKSCAIEYTKNWNKDNPEKTKNYILTYRYGISMQEFDDMISHQSGRCAICTSIFKTARETHIDHCHTSGKVRGILCDRCNHLLGHAKDSIQTLENAIHYLKYHLPKD